MFKNIRNSYEDKGTILVNLEDNINPFSKEDIDKLNEYCEKVDKEFVKIGDAGESNHLSVGRFMHDKEKPELANNPYASKVLEILSKQQVKKFIKGVINSDKEIFIRRAQYNEITKNCFVGYHLDVDSNPDYIAACVIQLGTKYEGGLYRVYNKERKDVFNDFKSSFGSLIISNCHYPHEVTKVEDGKRKSLVFFVSYHNGLNKRYS